MTLLPHQVGPIVVFGLDGSFLASASASPLGPRHWFELAASGERIREFDWPVFGVLQSPDGTRLVYGGTDAVSGGRAVFVRDLTGSARLLMLGDRLPFAWADADRVLVDPVSENGVVHAIDTRTLIDEIVFRPPPPPSLPATGEEDWFTLSGDQRWAIFHRTRADDSVVRTDLYDVARQTYVGATLPSGRAWTAPRGDLMVWLEGTELRAMHLCDRRVVTLTTIALSGAPLWGDLRWSADARFLSFAFGATSEVQGPDRVTIVDLQRAVVADLAQPWGFIWRWSPGDDLVVLGRAGFTVSSFRLARFSML